MRVYMVELDGKENKMIDVKDTENIVVALTKASKEYCSHEITAIEFFGVC